MLLTGGDGAPWHAAARQVRRALGVPLGAITVGGADVQDLSGAWHSAYGVDSDGAVLVRADGHIAWRSAGAAADAVALLDNVTDSWGAAIEFLEEDDEALADAIRAGRVARVRYSSPERVPHAVREAAASALQYVADMPISRCGRVELLWYLREQSISHVYHRYGNLGLRADEARDEPL